MPVNANLNQITFQSSLRSKPVRENFTDTENALNDLQSQINALATPPAGTEVTNARDNHTVLRDRLRSGFSVLDRYMVSGGLVAEDTGLNMKVTVALGEAVVAGVGCIWDAQTSGTITPHATLDRWDTVVVNSDNSISIVSGTASASPVLPNIASTQKKLAHLYITGGMTAITDSDIRDARRESIVGNSWIGADQIGTIKAWHKTFASVAIEEEYKECDGSLIDDPESPYYGLTIPDLNGGARFLKGAPTSGTLEASANKSHNHAITDPSHGHPVIGLVSGGGSIGTTDYSYPSLTNSKDHQFDTTSYVMGSANASATGISLADQGATDAVPKNMTVVWIMRIK